MQFFTGMPQNWFGFDKEGESHVDLEVRRYTKVRISELEADTITNMTFQNLIKGDNSGW